MPEHKNEKLDEAQPGLLHPDPDTEKPGFAPYAQSDAALHKEAAEHPETVMEAATESHHGLLREAAHKLSREEEAKLVLEHTVITPAVARTLTALFLLTIFSVPMIQHVVEIRHNLAARHEATTTGETPEGRILPQSFDVINVLPSQEEMRAARTPQEAWNLIPGPQKLKEFETTLEDDSVVAQWFLPRVQSIAIKHLGVGNEKAYLGRGGWLMYAPDVEYLTSRGFLDPSLQQVRKRSGSEDTAAVQPDPVKAIVHFQQQLAARGIELIVMPTPLKPMIHAEKMSSRYAFNHPLLQNPSYAAFRLDLVQQGVKFYDPAEFLIQAKKKNRQAQFLDTDTHWTPAAMQLAARELAGYIKANVKLPAVESPGYTHQAKQVANLGDIAEMLKLPANQKIYQKQQVTIRQVQTPDGEPIYPTRDADILLLGDSFSNIYSFDGMNWGEAAGLGEQLSYYLQRPFDAIINNAGGSHVTRQQLVRDLARGKDRLRGKRLVIWQFAMRDLLSGDWKLLKLPSGKKKT
jgi:alginate O-acetyltransferase complex protein AlgJ